MKRHLRYAAVLAMAALAVVLLSAPAAIAADDEEGFVSIFDGETLDGWDGNPKWWSVEDGSLTGVTDENDPLKYNEFCIWRQGELDDFELRFQYRLLGGNSGVQYRSWEEPDNWGPWAIGGYQGDFASNDKFTGILYGERFRGVLALRGQKVVIGPDHKPKVVEQFGDEAELQKYIKIEDWNDYQVICKGHTITHIINGHKMIEATDEDIEQRRRSGLLAFQIHRGPSMKVQARNIRLKRLPMEDKKKIVLIAGPKSHGYGAHEHNAGCLLLAKLINENVPEAYATVYQSGWPKDPTALDNADSVVMFNDGGGRHIVMGHLEELDAVAKKGVGVACLHYGVEIPKGEPGDYLLKWIGGYFETDWSVNPHWTAEFKEFPAHPVTRGVKPFAIDDEWYYHMRFVPDMKNVTPVLTAIPPESTRERPDGAHSNNPTVRARKGMPEHVGWVFEREDGGRGYGFTGGHWHWNWACDSFRKSVVNAIVWTAGIDIPEGGIQTPRPTMDELLLNQDYEPNERFNREEREKKIETWNAIE